MQAGQGSSRHAQQASVLGSVCQQTDSVNTPPVPTHFSCGLSVSGKTRQVCACCVCSVSVACAEALRLALTAHLCPSCHSLSFCGRSKFVVHDQECCLSVLYLPFTITHGRSLWPELLHSFDCCVLHASLLWESVERACREGAKIRSTQRDETHLYAALQLYNKNPAPYQSPAVQRSICKSTTCRACSAASPGQIDCL